MSRRGLQDSIFARTLAISLGPALTLIVLLTGYFTYTRLQDLQEELQASGQLIANQLAPASEFGVISGNSEILHGLLQASLTPHVRFIEVRDAEQHTLAYIEQATTSEGTVSQFRTPILRQQIPLDDRFLLDPPSQSPALSSEVVGEVLVGVTDEAFRERQRKILLRAAGLSLLALLLTLTMAYRLAQSVSRPAEAMSRAVSAIEAGNYAVYLPETDRSELGELARHINYLSQALERADQAQSRNIAQLIAAREQADTARDEAQTANKAKSEFLAMMSHELRTPMNGVMGMLQLLETTPLSEEQSEYTALALESTSHMLKVINELLDLARIERGALELERIPFELPALLERTVQAFEHTARQRNLRLQLQIAPLPVERVLGDPTRLRQILVNLIGNALKFTEQGHVCVRVQGQRESTGHLRLICAVEDTGIGIPLASQARIFDAFQQADTSISRRHGGTGLGLSIAHSLALRMGGDLRVVSEEGRGSCFTLEVLLQCEHHAAHTRAGAQDTSVDGPHRPSTGGDLP